MSIRKRALAASVLAAYLGGVAAPAAQAGMLGTETVLSAPLAAADVRAALSRDDVQAQLVRHGVDPAAAEARIDALSDAEVATLATRYSELPAGSAAADILIVGFIIWALLVATDYGGVLFDDGEKKEQTQ
ncbi:MAG: PA2779 family protein [Pseudomonadota bacterium]